MNYLRSCLQNRPGYTGSVNDDIGYVEVDINDNNDDNNDDDKYDNDKRDAGNAILNTQGKTVLAIFTVYNKQIVVR